MLPLLLLLLASPALDGCTGPRDPAGALAAELAALPGQTRSSLPSDFDLARASAGVKALLAEQGEVVGPGVTELAFTDADHTAVKTVTPLYFRNAEGRLLTDPETGAILMVRRRGAPEGARLLQQRYPQIDWSRWTLSWEEWDSIEGILSQESIPVTVARLRAASNRLHARVMVITARPAAKNGVAGFREWFRRRKVHMDGIFGVATPAQAAALQVDKPGYDDAMRKTLIIAAAIEAY